MIHFFLLAPPQNAHLILRLLFIKHAFDLGKDVFSRAYRITCSAFRVALARSLGRPPRLA